VSTTAPEILTLVGIDDASITATALACERRDALLARSIRGTTVNSPESATRAADILRELKCFADEIEDARVQVKAPVLDPRKGSMRLARDFRGAVVSKRLHLATLSARQQSKQNRLAAAASPRVGEEATCIRRDAAKERAAAKAREEQEAQGRRRARREGAEPRKSSAPALAGKANAPRPVACPQRAGERTRGAPAQADAAAISPAWTYWRKIVDARVATRSPAPKPAARRRATICGEANVVRYEAARICRASAE
jgi:hypothetical protein